MHAGQEPPGLIFRMAEVEGSSEPIPAAAEAEPLTAAETARVLGLLPDLPPETDASSGTVLRDPPRPPPRSGVRAQAPFPPAEVSAPPTVRAAGPLEVVSRGPMGVVDRGAQPAITFSQEMVPVSARGDVAAHEVPVRMTPQPPGRWRWIGTRTLVFQPEPSLPMATSFVMEVPAGVMSMGGGRLPDAVRWGFATGRPKLIVLLPRGYPALERHPTFLALFDQDVNPDSVIARTTVRAADSVFPVRAATGEELEDLLTTHEWVRSRSAGGVAFRTVRPLPGASRFDILFGAGIPSEEGPLRTDTVQRQERRTFGPLRVEGWHCVWHHLICNPGQSWMIRFSNPLDGAVLADSLVRIEPALEHVTLSTRGSYLVVNGASRPRTTYRVILDADIRDTFGQRLGAPDTVTIEVGPAPSTLIAAGGSFVVLDPSGPLTHSVRTVNVDSLGVRLYRVAPEDWPTFEERLSNLPQRHRVDTDPPGTLVSSDTIIVGGSPDVGTETSIDLAPALPEGLGHAVLVVEAMGPRDVRILRPVHVWLQGTRIGLSAFADRGSVVAWATDLETVRPLDDVLVRVLPGAVAGRTDDDGLARIPLRWGDEPGARLVVARRGQDVALLPLPVVDPDSTRGTLRWHVFTDRPLYRPEEEVHAKGWVRLEEDAALPDLALPADEPREVTWRVEDGVGAELARGSSDVGPLGGFDMAFTVPSYTDAGGVAIEVTAKGAAERAGRTHRHDVRVEEFRRPDFEVDLKKDAADAIVGGTVELSLAARYFAGGALSDARVDWVAEARPGWYRPPNREDFRFGAWSDAEDSWQELNATTDGDGRHAVRLELLEADPALPVQLEVSATVMDVNRQAWTESAQVLVHPSDVYVGLRTERRFVRRGEPLTVQLIAVDRDGEAVAGREVEVTAVRQEWEHVDGSWHRRELDAQECRRVSADRVVRCTFGPKPSGLYTVRARTTDGAGRPTLTELRVWVGGGWWARGPEADTADGVGTQADRDSYQPGDTAEILVQSPFESAEGVWTLRGGGIARAERFRVAGSSTVLRLPITEAHVPNVQVQVNLVGSGADGGQVASGTVDLRVPPVTRILAVRASPRELRVRPGDTTLVDLEVRDAHGRPAAGAEVALVVVDEAVWALAGDSVADPVASFYPDRVAVTREGHLRSSVLRRGARGNTVTGAVFDAASGQPLEGATVRLDGTVAGTLTGSDGRYELTVPRAGRYTVAVELIGYAAARQEVRVDGSSGAAVDFALSPAALRLENVVMAAAFAAVPGSPAPTLQLRADFDALAAFVPAVVVDRDGRATVRVRVPDNLTRYRVIAVAAHGAKAFGKGESSLTAGLPVTARPTPPRFLRRGDGFELPVVVQNTRDSAITAEVAVRGANVDWVGARGYRVSLPAGGRAEVRFPAITRRAGSAFFQVAAVAGSEMDAAQLAVPVRTPATMEAFATYGQVEDGAQAVPVMTPRDVLPDVGGLEVTASSTALSELTDAFLYLRSYPYECAEQIASRVLAAVELRDVLQAFSAAAMPDPRALRDSVQQDVRRLEQLQNPDGGFSFWGPGRFSWPFVSAHVTRALVSARDAGYHVRPETLERAVAYLGRMEQVVQEYWTTDARQTVLAYMLHARAALGQRDTAGVARVLGLQSIDDAPLEVLAWLLPLLAEDPSQGDVARAVHRQILNRATETAASAHFITGYDEGDYLTLRSSRRTDAVVLEALLGHDPANPLNPKLVRGLLDHRTRGRWANTQENVFVLLALARYFETFERTSPDFTARVWLGERFAGERAFEGHSADRFAVEVPMAWLAQGEPRRDLVLQKEGPGRLYYRVGMRYAPATLDAPAANEGFALERVYEAVDDSADVVLEEDGNWSVRAGARVRVQVTLAAEGRRTHVALVDPLPAGLEPLNPELRGSGARVPGQRSGETGGLQWSWFDHQNLRDDRAEAFASLLYGGTYVYTYLARATTPGEYIVPPPRAEEMYHPETFGRGSVDRVRVR
ncbi:MAG TPA: carboxypeptidase-like regulatory domain-containing protein [Gemmatimonadota bacterium]|nr:carboxypeptidase-like regulatory domain-containing protein [Gemmatimonadota bacterium]